MPTMTIIIESGIKKINGISNLFFLHKRFTLVIILSFLTFLFISIKINYIKNVNELEIKTKLFNLDNLNLKHILLWTPKDFYPFNFYGIGATNFKKYKCSYSNCFVSTDRSLFGNYITYFDIIAFNGRNIGKKGTNDIPKTRTFNQLYIYFNTESADYYPVCSNIYEDFFNLTATYRLDSDIPLPYINIKDAFNNVIGPKTDITWRQNIVKNISTDLKNIINGKTKAVAWFVSNCATRSKREKYAKEFQTYLANYNLKLDVYGSCGEHYCSKKDKKCDQKLSSDYFFYLSFENSFAEDYVTEKILNGLSNNVVPIVYGGANYSRFLPPDSYINAKEFDPKKLAAKIYLFISRPEEYIKFFYWKKYYSYHIAKASEYVCKLCAISNEILGLEQHLSYKSFRSWWNPNFKKICPKN